MAPSSYPVCSPGSAVTHLSCIFSSRPLPASSLSVTRPQAAPLFRVLSQMRLFSPGPLLLKDCGFDPFSPSVGGSHGAMAKCRLHPGMPAGPCCCRYPVTVARFQPAPEKVREIV